MKIKLFKKYYLFSLLGVILASIYPIYMGFKVAADMTKYGTVYAESYPKYIIPYTPISLSIIAGVAFMPIFLKYIKKLTLLFASITSTTIFFVFELILESTVIVTTTITTTLESWQMFMCATPPQDIYPSGSETITLTEVDILMGDYSPTFKIHFYIISIIIILSLLNCFYGFAKMIDSGNNNRLKPLIMQSIASVTFLLMCIYACFTAFYRTGTIMVSALSAALMSVFFVLLGVTMGIYVASFTLHKRKLFSVALPSVISSLITLIMYIGEMLLLSGNLYRFGRGFFFSKLGKLVLAPVDILIIILSGLITFLLTNFILQKPSSKFKCEQFENSVQN